LNSLLLDADVIIDVNRLGFWNQFVGKNKIYVASTVWRNEALFYVTRKGQRKRIRLSHLLKAGIIIELEATVNQQKNLISEFDSMFSPRLDPGETESLCILQSNDSLMFCTFDTAAIMALGLLGISHRGISLEKALIQCGLNRTLEYKCSEKRFKSTLKRAKQMRIMGQGLSQDIISFL